MARNDEGADRPDEDADARAGNGQGAGSNVFGRIARRLQNPRELSGDAKELLSAVVETSDRAKTEMVKLVAREVRNYLDELRLRDALNALLTGHSLEIQMSLSLKPKAGEAPAPSATASPAPATTPAVEGAGGAE